MRNIVKFLTEFFMLAFLGMPLVALEPSEMQRRPSVLVDHWPAAELAINATEAPCYYPTILRQQKLAENEVVRGLPQMSAVNMDLPDRMGGRGWVKIEAGRKFVYDRTTGQVLRLAECNNHVYDVVPFPQAKGLQGPPGPQGPRGYDGRDGRDAEANRREAIKNNTKGNWYTHSWRDRPVTTFFVHLGAGFLLNKAFNKDHPKNNGTKGAGDNL